MGFNPYEPPTTVAAPAAFDFDEVMRRDLRAIAKTQKAIIMCIAAHLALFAIAVMLVLAGATRDVLIFVRVIWIGVTIVELWAVAVLSSKLYGRGIAFFATLGMFVPCFSLVVLVMLSQAATKKLRDAGVRVGFFGAQAEIP